MRLPILLLFVSTTAFGQVVDDDDGPPPSAPAREKSAAVERTDINLLFQAGARSGAGYGGWAGAVQGGFGYKLLEVGARIGQSGSSEGPGVTSWALQAGVGGAEDYLKWSTMAMVGLDQFRNSIYVEDYKGIPPKSNLVFAGLHADLILRVNPNGSIHPLLGGWLDITSNFTNENASTSADREATVVVHGEQAVSVGLSLGLSVDL